MANRLQFLSPFKHREIDELGRADKMIEKVTMFATTA
jgi:hypothetical protein